MNYLGIEANVQNLPELDSSFFPLYKFNHAFLASAKKPIGIAVERSGGEMASVHTFLHGTPDRLEADRYYIRRLVKSILWMKGGWRVYISGDRDMYTYIRECFSADGCQAFDWDYFSNIYERPFEVVYTDTLPEAKDSPRPAGGHFDGCRIGFDAGGSDRKVSAVVDGKTIWSEEVVWNPKTQSDPDYHFNGIVSAFRSAASKMPRVDAIGISSAGIYVNNRPMLASLFLKVPPALYEEKVKDIYIRAVHEIGDVPFVVANDGDVTALAGAMNLNTNNVLGIAMGTSEAGGFVDGSGNITGWLNEFAFIPVDLNPDAMEDEWSGDIGCGVKYFSQDGVNKLAPRAGIALNDDDTPANKLKTTQMLMTQDSPAAAAVYRSIGVYLGHALAWYEEFYDIRCVLLLGRVMSGKGGNLILEYANKTLREDYPALAEKITLNLPDESARRVGQSVAAASLPEVK